MFELNNINNLFNMALDINSESHSAKANNNCLTRPAEGYYTKNRISLQEADQLEELIAKRTTMCGIGTKRVKNFLLRKAKEGDRVAEVLYVALNAEDKRISSRMCSDTYRDKNVNKASYLLYDLIRLIDKTGVGDYGYLALPFSDYTLSSSENVKLICIDLPGEVQIGFVMSFIYGSKKPYKGLVNSSTMTNLAKIEQAINSVYGEQILKKYGAQPVAAKVVLPNIVIERHDNYAEVLEPRRKRNNAKRQQVFSTAGIDVMYYAV